MGFSVLSELGQGAADQRLDQADLVAVVREWSSTHDRGPGRVLKIDMKYSAERRRVISGIRRVSKPGLRVYRKHNEVERVLGGLGIAVLSTSKGLMTDREARKRNVGGEVLCFVW